LFLLPRQDNVHMAFIIALNRPIQEGQQQYSMLVLQCTKECSELEINLDNATLLKEYNGNTAAHRRIVLKPCCQDLQGNNLL
jgi:structure-specific recognition protein 1